MQGCAEGERGEVKGGGGGGGMSIKAARTEMIAGLHHTLLPQADR